MEKDFTSCLVSFIIPVYQTPILQVERLLRSFSAARFQLPSFSFEVILIEDGSHIDGLKELCQQFDVTYLWQENGGPASARMTGIQYSRGEFLSFIDSDDRIEDDFLEILQDEIESGVDLIVFPYVLEGSNTAVVTKVTEHSLHQILLGLFFASYRGISSYGGEEGWYGYLWRYLYRKAFLLEHQIQFNLALESGEDNCYLIDVCLSNPRLTFSKRGYYHYCFNTNSISRKKNAPWLIWKRDRLLIEQLEKRGRQAIEKGLLSLKEYHQALYCRISTFAYVTLQNIVEQRLSFREEAKVLKAYQRKAREHRSHLGRHIKTSKRLFAFLFTYFGPYFCYLLIKGGRK